MRAALPARWPTIDPPSARITLIRPFGNLLPSGEKGRGGGQRDAAGSWD